MKTPYWLAENGYVSDPANPLRFINPHGHPFYPVEFKRDRQQNQGECLEAMLKAAHTAGMIAGMKSVTPHHASLPVGGSFTVHLQGKDIEFDCPEAFTPETLELKRIMEERGVSLLYQPSPDRVSTLAFHAIHNPAGEIIAIARQRSPARGTPAILASPAPDPQCDGCRWSWAVFNAPIGHPLDAAHCYMFRDRVEGCCKQETTHQRPKLALDSASGNLPVSNSVKNVRINID